MRGRPAFFPGRGSRPDPTSARGIRAGSGRRDLPIPRGRQWYARYRICGAICGAVSGGGQAGRMAAPIPDVGVGTAGDDDGGS